MSEAPPNLSWREHATEIASTLYQTAIEADRGESWLAAWWPSVVAAGKLGSTLFSLLTRLRGIVAEGDSLDTDFDVVLEIREHLLDIGDALPESGHLFDGLDIIDAMVQRILDDARIRGQSVELLKGLESMGDAFVAQVVSVWMNPDSLQIDPRDFEVYLERVEGLLRVILEKMVETSLRS